MSKYMIKKAARAVPLTGEVIGPWSRAEVLKIDHYPWYKAGVKQATSVRLLYDAKAIYVQFICEDKHIFARKTEFNGPVCLDSCVEFFATIEPAVRPDYFNLEINCCGQIHMGFGQERHGRILMAPELARRMKIVTSIKASSKEESAKDNGWWVAAAIPFDVISEFASQKNPGTLVKPGKGTVWKANFYRCGGKTDEQYAVWNDIKWAKPDYHRPEFFGELEFV
ncbi:MAG: carbohydrate-binding family 9-like protein [Phycisphaerae bacterium]